jgi:thiol-disulfide isomerase/thioredoxin
MENELLLRLLWSAALIALGAGLFSLLNRWLLARNRGRRLGLERARPGLPAVLYFTTPTCAPCKTVQRPAIQRLQAELSDSLQVIEIDAAARPEIAQEWGVLSVPTTFILDAQGQPRYVNHGVTNAEKLARQIREIQ